MIEDAFEASIECYLSKLDDADRNEPAAKVERLQERIVKLKQQMAIMPQTLS